MIERDESHLSAYLDEMLTGREMAAVRDRLRQQPDAEHKVAELRQTKELLRSLPEPAPPPDFWSRTSHRLRAFVRLQARYPGWVHALRSWVPLLFLVMVLISLLGLFASQAGNDTRTSTSVQAGRRTPR